MALFQNSVLNKYLNELDNSKIATLYTQYSEYFLNPDIQQNIRESKEEQFQEGFLRELFVKVLGYTINPNPNYNLTTELKNESGAKKADGAIMKGGKAIGVIELKSTTTKDLESIRQQAFDYKANHSECIYVVTSNFEKLRFYIDNAVDFEEFDLFTLTLSQFKLLYLCLNVDNILGGVPKSAKIASLVKEENVTKKLYADYSVFKENLFNNIISKSENIELAKEISNKGTREVSNKGARSLAKKQSKDSTREQVPLLQDNDELEKEAKLILFKKTQKLMDRFLFIFFSEDRGLIPPNTISTILTEWEKLKSLDAYRPLYDRFKRHFDYINEGWKGDNSEVFAYNGGLFLPDPILDNITIADEVLHEHTKVLTKYDFESEVDVNILGHIFEHSLTEIETVSAELEGQEIDKKKTKRKKDGVFYTPKYITKYILDNTVGKLCEEKKQELGIEEEDYLKGKKNRRKETIKKLEDMLITYRDWLLGVTIVDPACGSGAFLNQALEFLIAEHRWIDEMTAKLFGGGLVFQDVENSILENNLYGVDINEESVEIAKLSLWLRTAQKGRKLTSLNNNIKCGNSLIDDPAVAGDKAFIWEEEFPKVFPEKEKKAFHVTWVTHNSRTSQRMVDYNAKKGDGVWLTEEMEVQITKSIIKIVEEDELNVMAYNICGDHVHILLVCEEEEIPNIVRKLKSVTAREINAKNMLNKEKQDSTRELAPLQKVNTENSNNGTRSLAEEKNKDTTREQVPLLQDSDKKDRLNKGAYSLADETELSGTGTNKKGNKLYTPLWAQKYSKTYIEDEDKLNNTIEYIINNREKHNLPSNKELLEICNKGACSLAESKENEISNKGACSLADKEDSDDTTMEQVPLLQGSDDVTTHPLFRSQSYAFRTERKGGFDVVIGNPPYVSHDRVDGKKYLKDKYKTYQAFADLFCFFYELGIKIVKQKGLLSYITSNSFLRAEYGKPLRELLTTQTTILELIDIGEAQVFSGAVVNSVIVTVSKSSDSKQKVLVVNTDYNIADDFLTHINEHKFNYLQSDLDILSWNLIRPEILKLRNKISNNKKTLEQLGTKIRLGIATGSNTAFVIDEETKSDLIKKDRKNSQIIKPILRGKDIQRFYYNTPDLYVLLTKNGIDVVNDYPKVYEYLGSFGDKFKNRGAKGHHWTNLRACSFFDDFKEDKIVWIELTDSGRFSICKEEIYLLNSAYFLIPPKGLSLGYLISVLNSKIIQFYLKQIANTSGVGTTRWINVYVKEFPIVIAKDEQQETLNKLNHLLPKPPPIEV